MFRKAAALLGHAISILQWLWMLALVFGEIDVLNLCP